MTIFTGVSCINKKEYEETHYLWWYIVLFLKIGKALKVASYFCTDSFP